MCVYHVSAPDHIPKTGGCSVREFLLRNAGIRSPPKSVARLSGFVRHYEARCFICQQFPGLIDVPGACTGVAGPRSCGSYKPRANAAFDFNVRDSWKHHRLAVEFHGISDATFVHHVLPRMPVLQELYEQHNGTCATAVLVREPISFLFSAFSMWPPRSAVSKNITVVKPFPQWLRSAVGLQIGFLSKPFCTKATRALGQHSSCGCDGAAHRQALGALERIDIVGVTTCLHSFFDTIEMRLGLPKDPPRIRLQRRAHKGNVSAGLIRMAPVCYDCARALGRARAWSWDALSASEQARVKTVASCDHGLYAAALARIRTEKLRAILSSGRLAGRERCAAAD